ncbi:MAG: DnaJ domain-containing protein [Deltaproteobacteria bacterium]|nr:DnaJ domain-containing protein [Deltaproteobacteria bacterium]
MKLKLDYYRILNVSPQAQPAELKKAYRQLAVAWHPDRNPGSPLAEERFKAISEAYAVLSDPVKRRHYDLLGPEKFGDEFSTQDIFQGFEVADLFKEFGLPSAEDELKNLLSQKQTASQDPQLWQDFFSGFGQKPELRTRASIGPVAVDLTVSLKEAVFGAIKTVAFNTARGPVKTHLAIPIGAVNGQKLTFPQKGPARRPGKKAADLVVTVNVRPEKDFSRQGNDLLATLKVRKTELQNGCRPIFRTLDGRSLKLTIRPGTRPGTVLRAPGLGVPQTDGKLLITLLEDK